MSRGSEAKKSLSLRLKIAREELEEAKRYKYIIVNNNLEKAFKKLNLIVDKEIGTHSVGGSLL